MNDIVPGDGLPIVGIGASAGGLEALRELFGSVNEPTGMAFVVVQHLDPDHESLMAQLIGRETALNVQQVEGGEEPAADNVYVIPPGHGLGMKDGRLELVEFDRPRGMRRPIDNFFVSLSEEVGQLAACIILSGTGADGAMGLRAVKEHGGLVAAQEPTSARYDGMPLAAVGTGLVDFIREPGELIPTIKNYFARYLGAPSLAEDAAVVANHIDELCRTLREIVGHDFSGYKRSMLERRIARRMQVLEIDQAEDYLRRVRADRDECEALFRDLLINVTRFFRDSAHYRQLDEKVIRPLVENNNGVDELRIWVPGCSSGEEPFSIAILIARACDEKGIDPPVQIFATDIDDRMLNIAREALYPPASVIDTPDDLREVYFESHGEHVTVTSRVRDMVRFSEHSIVKDAPFSRVDLVSCRNLLIYFGDRLQQSVMPLLHYAIVENGYLFLGPSETIGRFDHLFEPIDQKARIFRRLPGRATYPAELYSPQPQRRSSAMRTPIRPSVPPVKETNVAVKRLVERYGPAAMVLDSYGEVTASFGRLSRYFEFPAGGRDDMTATSLARPGLREILLPLIREAQEKRERVIARSVEVKSEFGTQSIHVIADPLPDQHSLVVFREAEPFRAEIDDDLAEMGPTDGQVQMLEDELRLARHQLRCTVEELETVNEELKSSNEEMMSMNEELQSTNEELTTVNDELKSKVDQLTVANADLRNFFESTLLGVVVLDEELRVRSFTEAAFALFPLKPGDRGRGLDEITSHMTDAQYLADARSVIGGGPPVERQVRLEDGRTFFFRVFPYRELDNKVSGVTLVFLDVSEAAKLERELAAERERLALALQVSGIGVWEYEVDTGESVLDPQVEEMFGLSAADSHGVEQVLDAMHPEDRPKVEDSLRKAISGESEYTARFRVPLKDGTKVLRGLGRLIPDSEPARLIGVNFDVTQEAKADAMRELLLREMNHRVKNLFAIIGGMVTLSARGVDDAATMASTLRDRIAALGRAHALTMQNQDNQENVLGALVSATLEPYIDHPGLSIEGPELMVRGSAVSSLALLLHEWATNAVKYGALGDEKGTLDIAWTRQDDGGVEITWDEKLSAERNPVAAEGFGSTLVDVSVRQLRGSLEQGSDERGYRLALQLPPNSMGTMPPESSS